jgi:hypothetical protein
VPHPRLPLPPTASPTADAGAVGVLPATAPVPVVFIVGASDNAVKDAVETSDTAYSVIVYS